MNIRRGLIVTGLVFFISIMIWLAIPSPTSNTVVHGVRVALETVAPETFKEERNVSITLKDACAERAVAYPPEDLRIVVDKSEFKLYLYSKDIAVKTYPVSLGGDPINDKIKEGDRRTPEGEFYVCQKAKNPAKAYLGSRWLRLSYPNKEDAERGLASGVIGERDVRSIIEAIESRETPPQRTPLGGGIGIHGGCFDRYGAMIRTWTAGCVALYDSDIEEFYDYIEVGTSVTIKK